MHGQRINVGEQFRPFENQNIPKQCPICQQNISEVGSKVDGMFEVWEYHCSNVTGGCGLSYNPDGSFRAVPTFTFLGQMGMVESALASGIPLLDWKPESGESDPLIWANPEFNSNIISVNI